MKKKISNFNILCFTIICILIVIISGTFVKSIKKHNELLIYAMQSKVEYYAKRCYLESNCEGQITLNDLYEKDYIDTEVVNPVTKEVLDTSLVINYTDGQVVIDWS